MKLCLLAACAVLALIAGPALADPLGDAKAGMDALNNGDNDDAIRLFTKALDSGALTKSDRELAYVKRAEANLAAGLRSAALLDAQRALALSPDDSEAADALDKAKGAVQIVDLGPSLADTMAFIQTALEQWGDVRFEISVHDTNDNSDSTSTYFQPPAIVTVDPNSCSLSLQIDGQTDTIDFKTVTSTTVSDAASELTRYQHDSGHTNFIVTQTNPVAFATATEFTSGRYNRYFLDQDSAENFAKAMIHATKLCGGAGG